jgi:hypothetical protein
VGIGTISPTTNLDIEASEPAFHMTSTRSGGGTNEAACTWQMAVGYRTGVGHELGFRNNTAGATAMTIDYNGKVGIGETSPAATLHCKTAGHSIVMLESASGHDAVIRFSDSSTKWQLYNQGATGNFKLYDNSDDSVSMHVAPSGTSWVAGSDSRLKKNIIDESSRLEDLLNVKVRKFDWIADSNKPKLGFIAQELYEFCPEAVAVGTDEVFTEDSSTNKKGDLVNPWAISKESLVPMIVKAIQELSAKVTALENA